MISKTKTKTDILLMMLPYGCVEKCAITSKIRTVANLSPIIQEMIKDGLLKEAEIAYRERKKTDTKPYVTTEKFEKLTGKRNEFNPIEQILAYSKASTYEDLKDALEREGYIERQQTRSYNARGTKGEAGELDELEEFIEEVREPKSSKQEPKKGRMEGHLVKKSYLAITRAGMDYLFENAMSSDLIGRLSEEADDINYTVMGSIASNTRLSNINRQTVNAFMKTIEVDCLGEKALAPQGYYMTGDPGTNLSTYVLSAASELNSGKKEYPMLYDFRDIRLLGAMNNADGVDKSHYGYVTATHVLITPARKYIIYRSKKEGTGIALTYHNKTASLLNRVLDIIGERGKDSDFPVIILASGKTEFRKCIEKGIGAVKQIKIKNPSAGDVKFGHPASGCCIIPMNWHGAQILKGIVKIEQESKTNYMEVLGAGVRRQMSRLLNCDLEKQMRPVNSDKSAFVKDNVVYCLGIDLDVQRIMWFDRYAQKEKANGSEKEFKLIVRPWQVPYLDGFLEWCEMLPMGEQSGEAGKKKRKDAKGEPGHE